MTIEKGDPCYPDDAIQAVHSSGKRDMAKVNVIVVHDTEGGSSAKGAANWFHDSRSGGSAHIISGEDGCFRCLPDDVSPWGAPGANSNGLHIEIAGKASWTRQEWLDHDKTLNCAARLIAEWCFAYDIPATFVDAPALVAGEVADPPKLGITTHAEVSKAFKHSDHWDPGPNFPMDEFLARVQNALDQLPYT